MKANIDLRFEIPERQRENATVLGLLNGEPIRANPIGNEMLARWAQDAAKGNPKAQYELAKALTQTFKTAAENNRVAVKWLKKAIEQNHLESKHLLGILIARGQGIRPNPEEAVSLFREAAVMGLANAQYDLARALRWGFGCVRDFKESLMWFRLAAAQGHAKSQYETGIAYRDAIGCEENIREAIRYLKLSATSGHAVAARALAHLYLPSNRKEALHWLTKAAQTDVESQYELALRHQKGDFGNINLKIALSWAMRAALLNHPKAMLLLARLKMDSQSGLKSDMVKKLALLYRASMLNKDIETQSECLTEIHAIEIGLTKEEKQNARDLAASEESMADLIL